MSIVEFNSQMLSFRNPLKYFALSLTTNSDDADDLLQDTMLKAIKYREKFTDTTNLKAWLYTIMKNTFINNYRRQTKTYQIIDQSKDLHLLNIPQVNNAVNAISKISHRDILSAVEQLDEELKIPFQRFFDGFKYKEIAEELNIPIGTVKSRIFLARKKLMVTLKDLR